MTDIQSFAATFSRIAHSRSEDTVFTDYLDMVICALSMGRYEEEYQSIVKKYKRGEIDLFCELMAQMLIVMDNDGAGLKDCLGEFYQLHLSRGKHGQFFTPEHVCDAMAAMLINREDRDRTIMDPCCGSGRMLLSAAKVSRNNYFFGSDVDPVCTRMAAINLCLNSMEGEVAWMNSLTLEHWGGYAITRTRAYPRIPLIRKLAAGEGIIYNASPFVGTPEQEREVAKDKIIRVTQGKLNLE